jgi:hypothetical protein
MGGTTIKAGTLQLGNGGTTGSIVGNGFQPKAGNQLTLVTTGGVVSSRFARFVDPFATGPGFNTVDLVYGRNSVVLEFLDVTSPISPGSTPLYQPRTWCTMMVIRIAPSERNFPVCLERRTSAGELVKEQLKALYQRMRAKRQWNEERGSTRFLTWPT